MSRLTLRLPETLHQQLAQLAEGEGVSLNQLYCLCVDAPSSFSPYNSGRPTSGS